MKKLLLIQPPLHPESIVFGFMNPYCLEVLAASVKKEHPHIEVDILDFRVEEYEEGISKIKEFSPDIVGVTGISIDYPMMIKVLKDIKEKVSSDILNVVGGHHATMLPYDFHLESCDIIVKGQGIITLNKIIENYQDRSFENVKGIEYRSPSGTFTATEMPDHDEKVNDWPLPLHELTAKYRKKYYSYSNRSTVVTTSQGCPYRCNFCACWKVFHGKYLPRPIESVIAEIKAAPEDFVFFGDDLTFCDIERIEEIALRLKKEGIKKKFTGYCRANIIVKYPHIIKLWKEVGLFGLTVGMEAIDNEGLKELNKNSDVEVNNKANDILFDLGIFNFAHIIIKPDYSFEKVKKISRYLYDLGVLHPVFPTLTPLPGTDLWEEKKDKLVNSEYQFFDLGHPLFDITPGELDNYYKKLKYLYTKNYSFSRWIVSKFKGLVNFISRKEVYSKKHLVSPQLLSVIVGGYWVAKQYSKVKFFKNKVYKSAHQMS